MGFLRSLWPTLLLFFTLFATSCKDSDVGNAIGLVLMIVIARWLGLIGTILVLAMLCGSAS
jgi:hypothetical protein